MTAKKKSIGKSVPRIPVKADPKIVELLQQYELPKTIFYHATETQTLQLLKHQALHHRLLVEAHSPMKRFNDNRLAPETEIRRKLNKTELKRKWTDNIGVPLSIKSTLSKSDLIEFIFRLYRDQASLAKINNGHSEYSQHLQSNLKNKNKKSKKTFSDKTKHEQFRAKTKLTKKRRQMAYDTFRKVVFESYATGSTKKGSRASYLIPTRPKTARTKSSICSSLKNRKNKSQATLFSKNLKTEVEKLCEKKDATTKKRTQIRLIQSARKHKPTSNVRSTKKKLKNGSFTARTARKSTFSRECVDDDSLTIVDKILSIAHTKEANEKYGNTVPAFRAAFVQEMYQYSKRQLKENNHKKEIKTDTNINDVNIDTNKESVKKSQAVQPRKPEFKCPVGPATVFTGRRASAFSEFGKRECDYDRSKFIRRQAYDKMVKQNVKVKKHSVAPDSNSNKKVPQLNLDHVKSSH